MAASCLIDAFPTVIRVGEAQRPWLNDIPPNGINDFLARRTLDETFGSADDSQLDSIANGLFDIIISFFPRAFEDTWIASDVDWPTGGDRQGKVEQAVRVDSHGPNCQYLAQGGPGLRQWCGCEVLVITEADAVDQKAKHDRFVALVLDEIVFLFKRADKGVGEVGGGQLFAQSDCTRRTRGSQHALLRS